jgi:uncharacterized protein YfdQ (DUF2303 family)
MFTKEAITTLQEAASIDAAKSALVDTTATKELTALPSDYKLHDLEQYLPNRRRARGTMETAVVAAFGEYVVAHGEAGVCVFVNQDSMTATAVLNLGTPEAPGHTDNRAKLELKKTAAYRALLQHATGSGLKQATVAEFLEDWPTVISCFNEAGPIAPAQAVAAIRKLTVESMRKLESSEQLLSTARSAFESVTATSADPLPTTIVFLCQPYADLQYRPFVLRLGVLTGDGKPTITLRITKAEEHAEDMAEELGSLIEQQFSDQNVPVLLGSYSKAQ